MPGYDIYSKDDLISMFENAIKRIDAFESAFEYGNPGWEAVYRLANDEITMRKCLELLREI